jgi:DNA-binding LacI/PurR family transcriptional regulator
MGLNVPKDISVIGFDDVVYSKISTPKITTMKVSRKYMAEQAMTLILIIDSGVQIPLPNSSF